MYRNQDQEVKHSIYRNQDQEVKHSIYRNQDQEVKHITGIKIIIRLANLKYLEGLHRSFNVYQVTKYL